MENVYYIYQHRKKDTNEIFYVGKGKKLRHLETTNRNKYWHNIVNKHGFISEILFEELDEKNALNKEKEIIASYKKKEIKLCNLTDGGEGVSGLKHSEEVRKKIGIESKGRKHTEETKKKIGNFWKGKKRNPFSEEHRKKISEKRKNQIIIIKEETKLKISSSNKGKKRTPEQRKRISEATKLAIQKMKEI